MSIVPTVGMLMSTPAISIDEGAFIKDAKSLMLTKSVKHLPVVDGEKLCGIITDRDIKMAQSISSNSDFHKTAKVEDVYKKNAFSVDRNEYVDTVLEFLLGHKIGSALVTEDEKLVGIFTMSDAVRGFLKHLNEQNSINL